jgi:hypothetical protein
MMKGMNDNNTAPLLTEEFGSYLVTVDMKRTRLRIEKDVYMPNGDTVVKTMFIPMEQTTVALMHTRSGDVVLFKQTAMGRKVTLTRFADNLPPTMRKNLEATGDAMLANQVKPEGITLDKATATICRMTGITPAKAAGLFNGGME